MLELSGAPAPGDKSWILIPIMGSSSPAQRENKLRREGSCFQILTAMAATKFVKDVRSVIIVAVEEEITAHVSDDFFFPFPVW